VSSSLLKRFGPPSCLSTTPVVVVFRNAILLATPVFEHREISLRQAGDVLLAIPYHHRDEDEF
jgi:hypothetical protein